MISKNTMKHVLILTFGLSVFNSYGFSLEEDFDINTLEFVEEEQEWELGFDASLFLPENFNPYSDVIAIGSVNFIEDSDEIELGFDTEEHLPEGFDPYIR